MMLRSSPPSRRLELLSFFTSLTLSLILLALPDELQISVANALGRVVTEPYWQVRNFGEDILRVGRENESLQARVTELELLVANLERSHRDGQRTMRMPGGLDPGYQGRLLPCEVVVRKRQRFATMIKIRSSVPVAWQVYQPVISPAGLLGRVRKPMGDRTAWVELLTAPDVAIGCEIERTGLLGVLRPRAGQFVLEMIGRDEDVQIGDQVITSGIAEIKAEDPDDASYGLMPRGLPLGSVSEVSSPPDELFKEIQIKARASFDQNETVFVLGSGGGTPSAALVRETPGATERQP